MYPKDTFLKTILHKIKNLLMVMQLDIDELAEYIEKNYSDDHYLIDSIKKQHDKMLEVIKLINETKEKKQPINRRPAKTENISGKILLVDDEEDLLKIMKRSLEKIGLEVETVTSGTEAMQKLKNNRYHYFITDLKMPVIDGQTLIRLTREEGLLEDTVVIVITGGLLNEYSLEQRESLKRDIDGFLQKPFTNDELYKLIRSFEP